MHIAHNWRKKRIMNKFASAMSLKSEHIHIHNRAASIMPNAAFRIGKGGEPAGHYPPPRAAAAPVAADDDVERLNFAAAV